VRADWAIPALAAHVPRLAVAYGIQRVLDTPDRVAITFDDGPHPDGTPAVLAELERHGVSATFFLVGEQVARDRQLAREIAAAGHEIAVHGYRHTLVLRRTVGGLSDDLDRAHDAIANATGTAPVLYRPPYGVFSSGALDDVRARGWRPVLWSRWGRDWERRATPSSIARRATRHLRPGDVVLLHDSDAYSSPGSWRKTAAALPSVLEAVATLGVPASAVTHST
jgi:peptidoglycan/xylan/chitin deacetylase (PgdA/CDA1 family)